jgi:hypothetical protein
MKPSARSVLEKKLQRGNHGCNHPLAVLVDPTDFELRELERMLAECPNCSRWTPGDGPIVAILLSPASTRQERKEIR